MKRITIADVEILVDKHRGNIAAIARELKVSRGTIYNRIKESPKLGAAIDDAKEAFVDEVESALFNNALGGNVAAQIFIMKAHPAAKRRGWSERAEIANATDDDGEAIPFRIIDYRVGFTETEE